METYARYRVPKWKSAKLFLQMARMLWFCGPRVDLLFGIKASLFVFICSRSIYLSVCLHLDAPPFEYQVALPSEKCPSQLLRSVRAVVPAVVVVDGGVAVVVAAVVAVVVAVVAVVVGLVVIAVVAAAVVARSQ